MGIFIKNMKMPKDDETIKFVKLLNGKIVAVTSPTKGVGDIHEVIEVTEPHGPLIDADEMERMCPEAWELIAHQPTVIEAEGDE